MFVRNCLPLGIYFFNLQLGTGLSILIAKRNPSLVTTFSLLSCGYILSSYREVCLLCMLWWCLSICTSNLVLVCI